MYRPRWHLGCTFNFNESNSFQENVLRYFPYWKEIRKIYSQNWRWRPDGKVADIRDSYKYLRVPPASGSLEGAARKPKTCKESGRSREVSSKHIRPASQSYPTGVMSGSKEEIESADVWTCMADCIPSPASGCWIVQVVSSTIQKTQQRSMSTLERCPQWWVAKWIPQAGEQQLETSLKDKPQRGWSQEVADIRKTYQRLRKAERQHRGTDHGSTGAIEARICRSRQEPYRSNPFSSHLITRLSFVMGSSHRLQMHKVPFAAKFSISFSTSRQHLVPPTCLTSTQGQCFQTSHGWGHPLLKHASARSGVVAQNFQLSSHPGSIKNGSV